ncbi:hypothetical protein, variant 1 [Capsaspora owczarzaki ATCC 30864]|uniref:Uncharacterized protein n=1 Tax=Capsaspora owczarzaki (strain ATCC 30864) TaxID=595528 RepID=A0A0D2X058_CAPO3|nr:hypothetical protein, variant 1 [Capsaspora owczarzaki ATCC 30864]KJE88484.1 hypothetical protein CAOG_000136 [Capsaspora owczarzaki ATCC 30864]|eukprot:XP_011269938.1 hypothetical protein, variant 1 [Capsaspora owczarzaki ATCC 30864]
MMPPPSTCPVCNHEGKATHAFSFNHTKEQELPAGMTGHPDYCVWMCDACFQLLPQIDPNRQMTKEQALPLIRKARSTTSAKLLGATLACTIS